MAEQKNLVCARMSLIIRDMNCYISFLYTAPHAEAKYYLLNQLRSKMQELEFLHHLLCLESPQPPSQVYPGIQMPQLPPAVPEQSTFTREELTRYNGRDGNPAYVAVDGIVYDVTQNAAWAAATHFGLSAGRDLSGELTSCHPGQAGQQIISRLPVVGRLI